MNKAGTISTTVNQQNNVYGWIDHFISIIENADPCF